jgi:DNA-directed RNA polymerase specialized sigma24 family protein
VQVTRDGESAQLGSAPSSSQRDSTTAQRAQDEGVAAFEYLCRRHVGPVWDIAYAVTGQPQDAAAAVADAFVRVLRPGRAARFDSPDELDTALLIASRAAAIEAPRRPDTDRTGEVALGPGLEDGASETEPDSGSRLPVVTAAYRSLPERWRSVLWLTDVRHSSEAEATAVLGVSTNGLAQLSTRARSGLRERYLQAHLQGTVATGCRPVVEHFGALATRELPPSELTEIEGHLRSCDDCRDRVADLDDLGAMLARIAVPVPATLVSTTTSRWKAAANAATVVSRSRLGLLSFPSSGRKPVAGAALAVLGLGIIGTAVVSGPLLNHGRGFGGLAPAAAAPTEVNQSGTGGLNPFLLSGDQSPAPTFTAPPAPTTTAAGTSETGAASGATAAGGGGAGASGGHASSTGVPSAPSAPTTTIVRSLPPPVGGGPPLPAVTLPPATLPPLTVPTTIALPKVSLAKIP